MSTEAVEADSHRFRAGNFQASDCSQLAGSSGGSCLGIYHISPIVLLISEKSGCCHGHRAAPPPPRACVLPMPRSGGSGGYAAVLCRHPVLDLCRGDGPEQGGRVWPVWGERREGGGPHTLQAAQAEGKELQVNQS